MIILTNSKVILKNQIIEKNIWINKGEIIDITDEIDESAKIIDLQGLYLSPGFIDIHMHARAGYDMMHGTKEALDTISSHALKTGTTSFLATTMTQSVDLTKKAITNAYDYQGQEKGAKVIGIHMEGPFINQKYKGAQPGSYILEPTIENFKAIVDGKEDFIKLITIAPEIKGANALIEELIARKITVSLGHTAATYDQVKDAVKQGLNHASHTFNAMAPFTHRDPATVGAIFDSEEIYAELILDGLHVHYASASILLKQKGIDKVVLISDSMEATGLGEGTYQLGGQYVSVKGKEARLEDGTLAGSVISMNQAVMNACKYLGLPIYEAVRMASLNPAKSLNIEKLGAIKKGYIADLIAFDKNINIKFSMINGEIK